MPENHHIRILPLPLKDSAGGGLPGFIAPDTSLSGKGG